MPIIQLMKASDGTFLDFLSHANYHFEIPVYQRNYEWGLEQCRQLLNDLEMVSKNNLTNYFLGSIVFIQGNRHITLNGTNSLIIIDGQQRITTITLLLLAISRHLKNKEHEQRILNSYILNPNLEGEARVKLKPIEADANTFDALVRKKDNDVLKTSNLYQNYKLFEDELKNNIVSADDLFSAIGKLKFVEISLDTSTDDPQLIFESLNSTGKGLSDADLVRNFILMRLKYDEQQRLYKEYWQEIEENCGNQIQDFLLNYLAVVRKQIPTKKHAYKLFKQHCFENGLLEKPEEHLKQIKEMSRLFSYINQDKHPDKDINVALDRIRLLAVKPMTPYLLELLADHENRLISKEIVLHAINTSENYVVRRSICDIPSSSYRKTYLSLHREVKRAGEDWANNYKKYLEFVYSRKVGRGRYPQNIELIEALKTRNFYKLYPAARNMIFESLENHGKKESVDVLRGLDENKYSIEHVMPQKLNTQWRKMLGTDANEIHESLLNTIGNLTVTAFNSKMSNKSFEEKLKTGFVDSPFWLNKFIKDQGEWGKEQIEKRTKGLTNRALEVWQEFEVDPNIETEDFEEIPLSEFDNFSYANPIKLSIEGKDYEISTFRELKECALKDFMNRDLDKLFHAQRNSKRNHIIVTRDSNDCKSPLEFSEGLYTESHASANTITRSLIEVAGVFDIALEDITITIEAERRNRITWKKKAA